MRNDDDVTGEVKRVAKFTSKTAGHNKGKILGPKPGARRTNKVRLDRQAKQLLESAPKKLRIIKPVSDIKEVVVTPEYAARLLEKNTSNRNVRDEMVFRYARDMIAGRWKRNGATIVIADDGTILDGQHRLYAVLESGVSVPLLVMENASKDIMPTIDTGTARTMGDVFKIEGKSHAHTLAGAVRWWFWYLNQRNSLPGGPERYTHDELGALYDGMPEIHGPMIESTKYTQAGKLAGGSMFAFVFSGAALHSHELAVRWAEGVDTGANLASTSPALTIRDRLTYYRINRIRQRPAVKLAYMIKSWNAFAAGRTMKNYRMGEDEEFPVFYGDVVTGKVKK